MGCAAAWELARRGVRVALVDRGEVSGGSTGLGEGNVLCCDKPDVGPELELARRGLALYDEIEDLLGAEAGIRRKGALLVHSGEAVPDAEAGRLERMRAAGVECEALDPGQTRAAEPELTGALAGSSFFPGDLQCAPRAIARGLAREAGRLGAEVMTGVRRGGDRGAGRAGGGPDHERRADPPPAGCCSPPAPGAPRSRRPPASRCRWSRARASWCVSSGRPRFLRRKVVEGAYMDSVASPAAGLQVTTVIETTLDGHVLVGSSRERRGFDVSVDPAVSAAMLERARRLAPGLAGLASATPGPACGPGCPTVCRRWGRRGWSRGCGWPPGTRAPGWRSGPISGRLVAQGICGEAVEPDLAPVRPRPFRLSGSFSRARSASALRPLAKRSNEGPRSGMERPISGRSGPLKSSRMSKRVEPLSSGVRVKLRTPLNSPSGIPPVQVIWRPGLTSSTLTG